MAYQEVCDKLVVELDQILTGQTGSMSAVIRAWLTPYTNPDALEPIVQGFRVIYGRMMDQVIEYTITHPLDPVSMSFKYESGHVELEGEGSLPGLLVDFFTSTTPPIEGHAFFAIDAKDRVSKIATLKQRHPPVSSVPALV
jgi:hypothetical protein